MPFGGTKNGLRHLGPILEVGGCGWIAHLCASNFTETM